MEKETRERGGSGVHLGEVDMGTGENPKLGTGILVSSEENVHGAGEHADVRLRNNDLGLMQCGNGISEPLNQVDQGTSGDLSNSVHANVLEDVIVIDSEENSCLSKENGALIVESKESGSSEALAEASQRVIIQDRPVEGGINETIGQVDKGSHGSLNNSQSGSVVEVVIVINSQEAVGEGGGNRVTEMKGNGLGSSKVLEEKPKAKPKSSEADNSCVIDIKSGASGRLGFKETSDGERVCRICHLTSEQLLECDDSTSATATDLIQLGCACKDELGIAHSHCAEAWFKLKGNRFCEICGESAKNVTGVGDNRFVEEWNVERYTLGGSNSSNRGGGCWRRQPFCNFLMACLVIAFVLPWFFRVNMF
ncbi:hypothetical protein SLEP1_g7882 [Rubroshorea leprosula]|uniref:RING-CH-type domain-containing protein n=1 Tax=Rubroshorea leprosula TaxID=152421 RepID=A0AAV5I5K6_9ROSI|nr:hypothetical protein SLEP1_g7882 [Rubroshorea leprosula]